MARLARLRRAGAPDLPEAGPTMPEPTATTACCSTDTQSTCCDPSDKAGCCDPKAHAAATCACAASGEGGSADIREAVRARYAAAATTAADGGSCCGPDGAVITDEQAEHFGHSLYADDDRATLPDAAVMASLGCGNPTAVAELREGETVLDLGSGGGIDVLLSARRVGPTGKAYGLDMTDEMLALARENQAKAGVENVEFLKGEIEAIPLPDASVDVIISNCVINLSGDKPRVIREAARVLRPGGRFAVSDVIADPDMNDATRADMQQWTGCIAGALTRDEFRDALATAGLIDTEIVETHRVHDKAGSAIVRARKPA